MVDLANAA
jgi:hypothetical protein